MAKLCLCVLFTAVLVAVVLVLQAGAITDTLDAIALHGFYKSLNQPPQPTGLRLDGDNPCDELWHGVSCSGSSVIYLKLHGLNLSGLLPAEIYNLQNLKQLDVSSNSISGEIPCVTSQRDSYKSGMQPFHPKYSALLTWHEDSPTFEFKPQFVIGPIGNIFTGLQSLRELDLSYNNFSGYLPSSFGSLTNLTGLYLQNNKFMGSVTFLAELPLIDLIGGNSFHVPGNNYPPWNFSLDVASVIEQNIHPSPATHSSAIEKSYPSTKLGGHKKIKLGPGGIAFMISGGTLVASCVALYIAVRINRSRAQKLITMGGSNSSIHSFSVMTY